jgi:putative spermidine/putrescine transport system permease protein
MSTAVRRSPVALAGFYALVALYVATVAGLIGHVVVSSMARGWFGTLLPKRWTLDGYRYAWQEFALPQVLKATFLVTAGTVGIALLIALPTAYVLARYRFPGKGIVLGLFLLPVLMPQFTYGIPLATMLYKAGLGGTMSGVILANLVPVVPYGILVLTPFIEQVPYAVEASARALGATRMQIFRRVLLPLLRPGLLSATVIMMVRTVGNFELTFLVSGADSQTLVVALYYAAFAAGVRPIYAIDAMAVVYAGTVLLLLTAALRYVKPTQMVFRLNQ